MIGRAVSRRLLTSETDGLNPTCACCYRPAPLCYTSNLDESMSGLGQLFRPLKRDDETNAFLASCFKRDFFSLFLDAVRGMLASFLTVFFARLSVNAWLHLGQMHVLTTKQAEELVGSKAGTLARSCDMCAKFSEGGASLKQAHGSRRPAGPPCWCHLGRSLLDVGAGDGHVTDSLAPLFDTVVATEASTPLARRLRSRGYRCVVTCADMELACREAEARLRPGRGSPWWLWGRAKGASSRKLVTEAPSLKHDAAVSGSSTSGNRQASSGAVRGLITGGERMGHSGADCQAVATPPLRFDVIACLNVLDRCDAPLTLLRQCRDRLRPTHGRLLLAVVLPFKPFVEHGTERRSPTEVLPVPCCGTWEEAVEALVEKVLVPCGFAVQRIARAPYLSRGHAAAPVLSLDDAIFVLSCQPEGKWDA